MAVISLIFALCALCCCVWLYLELQKKLSSEDIASKLALASEELSKTYARSLREIETEWADMYQKFSRLAGRVDKNRGLEAAQNAPAAQPQNYATGTRSDLLRKHRGGTP
jgi:hypothetical protein